MFRKSEMILGETNSFRLNTHTHTKVSKMVLKMKFDTFKGIFYILQNKQIYDI